MAFIWAVGLVAASGCGTIPSDLLPGKDVYRTRQQTDSNPLLGTIQREYMIRLPSNYNMNEPSPILFSFHGWGDNFEWSGKLPDISDAGGYVLVRPNGMSDGQDSMGSWNVGQAGRTDICSAKTTEYEYTSCIISKNTSQCNCGTCYDDVKFVADLVDDLRTELCIDADHIYSTGYSFGAMFSYFLAPELIRQGYDFRIAAILPWYGAFYKNMNEPPLLPGTSVFHFHGDKDTTVPADGSDSYDGYHWVPVEETLSSFAAVNGCASTSSPIATPWDGQKGQEALLGCTEWLGCNEGRIVRCNFRGAHGIWPTEAEDMMAYFLNSISSKAVV